MTPVRLPRGRTLRARLTALLVVVLLVTTAVAGTVTALALRTFLLGRLDAQLVAAGSRFADDGDGDADDVAPGQAVGTVGVRLRDGRVLESAIVAAGGRTRTAELSPADVRALTALPVGGGPRTIDLDALHDYRLQAAVGTGVGAGGVQVTGLPEAEVDATMRRLIAVESVLFVVVIAAAGAVVAVLVRRTLRPLQALAGTARDVTRLPLSAAATPLPVPPRAGDATSEVGQVATAFAQMLDHIRAALAERDATEERLRRFVADASHEFRTPLATVRAHSELVQHAPLPADVAQSLRRIDAATDRMSAMVEDLLMLARLDDDAAVPHARADLSRGVVEALVEARTLAPDHHWVLRLPDAPVEVSTPADRLERVVVNLLANARVHTPPGTTVEVAVLRATGGGPVRLTVTDDGPGVAPAVLPTLFDRFTRGDAARTSSSGGSGLGLALVRAVVRAHGGDVDVDSRPGRTAFTVRWPGVTGPATPSAPRVGEPLEAL